MNECSPKGFYSGLTTAEPQPQAKIGRPCWEENWEEAKANPNLKPMNSYRTKEGPRSNDGTYQILNEDLVKVPNTFSVRKKCFASDPRFKRVINSEIRSNQCADKAQKITQISEALKDHLNEDKILANKMISYLKSPKESSLYASRSAKKFKNMSDDVVTKDVGFNMAMKYVEGYDPYTFANVSYQEATNFDNFKEADKIKINFRTNLKRSASDCTLHTRNYTEDNEEELQARLRNYPSGTKIGCVHDWIKGQDEVPEKRRSVITVIGQTQTKSLKQVLSEINQRRKLVKELDKHALCEAIMESNESQSDVKNLIAKIDFVLPDGKVIYSTEKVYLCKDNSKLKIDKDCGEFAHEGLELLEAGDQYTSPAFNDGLKATEQLHRKRCEMIPERDSSVTQVGKRSRGKRSNRKLTTALKEKDSFKDRLKSLFRKISFKLLLSLLFLVLVGLSIFFGYSIVKPRATSFVGEFFKPKTTAWYEKLLY